jgi:hypothetical protein
MSVPKELQWILKGPEPRPNLDTDGCTMAPDLWIREACLRHDEGYQRLHDGLHGEPGSPEWTVARRYYDSCFRIDIITLSRYIVTETGTLKLRPFWSRMKRIRGWYLSTIYWMAVRLFGGIFAKATKGKRLTWRRLLCALLGRD